MPATLGAGERSTLMSKVRSRGNHSTERRVEAALVGRGMGGWEKHPRDVPGRPDFFFRELRIAVFVDGCFWHACPKCGRMPKSNVSFWQAKIDGNRRRDNRVRRCLRRGGFHVVRIWEHQLAEERWLRRLATMVARAQQSKSDVIGTQ